MSHNYLARHNVFTNRNWKVRTLQLMNHIAFVYALTIQASWVWWASAVFMYFLMFCVGIDIGVHRYFTHNAFKTNIIYEWFFCTLMTLSSVGSSLAWVGMHRMHHRFSDTPRDPHTPIDLQNSWMGFWRAYLGVWTRYSADPRYIRDVRRQTIHKFFHFNYFLVIIIFVGLLSLLSIKAALFLYFVPAVLSFHAASWIVAVGHTLGEQPHSTNDHSKNSLLVHFVTWGEGLHNAHHAYPDRARHYHNNPLFFDLPGFLIETVFTKSPARVSTPPNLNSR